MARYRLLRIGVLDTQDDKRIVPQSGVLWDNYLGWLRDGGIPDHFVPEAPPPETLAEAKARRRQAIAADGLARMQARLPALRTFDDVQLLREVFLSVVPAARQPTADLAYVGQVYDSGKAAIAAVQAAATIAEVDAVVVAWP